MMQNEWNLMQIKWNRKNSILDYIIRINLFKEIPNHIFLFLDIIDPCEKIIG